MGNEKQTIVITGCSSGIGLETVVTCSKNNYKVFACVRSLTKSAELQNRINAENLTDVHIVEMDMTETFSIINGFNEIRKKTEQIDILFNNAGKMILGSLEDLSENELHEQLAVDLIGIITLTQKVIPIMRVNGGGLIINMGSIAGRIGFPLSSPYCISKFGLEGLSQALRRELAPKNIHVCIIEAGIVDTKFFENTRLADASKKSAYTLETFTMNDLIKQMKKDKYSTPNNIAEKILEIIESKGEDFRYIIGNDAEHVIGLMMSCGDNQKSMDKNLEELQKDWVN